VVPMELAFDNIDLEAARWVRLAPVYVSPLTPSFGQSDVVCLARLVT
jgi:hypothetical protein